MFLAGFRVFNASPFDGMPADPSGSQAYGPTKRVESLSPTVLFFAPGRIGLSESGGLFLYDDQRER